MAKVWWVVFMTATLLAFSACREDDGRGRQLDDAMRSLASDAQQALEGFGDEIEDAVETSREVARDVGDRALDATDDAIDAADEALESAQDALGDS
jgi:ABC-type transporter Mla subunit MlaD